MYLPTTYSGVASDISVVKPKQLLQSSHHCAGAEYTYSINYGVAN